MAAAAANAAWPVVNVNTREPGVERDPGGVVKSNDIKYLTERAAISSETTRAPPATRGRQCFPMTIPFVFPFSSRLKDI